MNVQLHAELVARAAEDQRIRNRVLEVCPPGQMLPAELAQEWSRIDEANTLRLHEIVARHGWPGHTLVGDEGAEAAWLLAPARRPKAAPATRVPHPRGDRRVSR